MKIRKRFTTEAEVLTAIDAAKARADKAGKEAERLDKEADRIRVVLSNTPPDKAGELRADLDFKRKQAKKLWKRASNLIEKKVKKLGKKLAELRTPMALTGTGLDDNSVPQ